MLFSSRWGVIGTEQELLSKKELLDLTGISYGQLYRWKRKNLIPEAWFVRKSTFTGQETFFPKDKILVRIAQIKDMKDERSLDELADMFSANPSDVSLSLTEAVERNIVTDIAADVYESRHTPEQPLSFEQLFSLYVVDTALKTGDIQLDESTLVLQTMEQWYDKFDGSNCQLLFIRKLGVSSCLLAAADSEIHFDPATRVVLRLDLSACMETLKVELAEQ